MKRGSFLVSLPGIPESLFILFHPFSSFFILFHRFFFLKKKRAEKGRDRSVVFVGKPSLKKKKKGTPFLVSLPVGLPYGPDSRL